MKIETLHDILDWTRQLHQHLARNLQTGAKGQVQERVKLLLEYLAEHENQLSQLVGEFESSSDAKALNTWCYEYFKNNSVGTNKQTETPFAEMTPEQIIQEVSSMHQQVIDLYRQLGDQFESPPAIDLIQNLLELEEHEAMRMVQGSNRLEDI